MRFDDEATSIRALVTGRSCPRQQPSASWCSIAASRRKFEAKITLVQNHFGIGMRRGQTDLRQWVNTFLYAIKNNGELDAISQKWIGESLQPLPTF